jgi:glycosyltransferase involved in cell wall biosynthesis
MNQVVSNLRILMVGPGLDFTGGISAVVRKWLDAGLCKKIDLSYVETLTESRPGFYPGKLTDGSNAQLKFLVEIWKPYDLVHIHLSYGASFYRKYIFFIIATLARKKTLIHLHGSKFEQFYCDAPIIIKKLISSMFNQADCILVLSKYWQDFAQSITSNPKVHILFNGAFPRDEIQQRGHKDFTITFMGRLGERKGVYDLIDAFEVLHKEFMNTRLLLCGDGDIDNIKRIIRRKGLQNTVKVPGWVSGDEKDKTYCQTDLFVLPSYHEGLPGAILEAMSYGLPVISTEVGGIPEAVQDGINGALIRAGDVPALIGSMKDIIQDQEKRTKMGQASRQHILKTFNIYLIVDELVKEYSELAVNN